MAAVKNFADKISFEQIKVELLNTAYGNDRTLIARLDPRTLFIWYMLFGIAPWFIYSKTILAGLLLFVIATTIMTRVSRLVIFILILGLLGESGYMLIAALFFGGNLSIVVPLLMLTMKLSVISLASMTTFCSMSPERLGEGLMSIGVPGQVSFSISYGYRMLPNLFDEYNHIFMSYRLRGKSPEKHGIFYWRSAAYFVRLAMKSFYPLLLSMAKRARTTVEALETKGGAYAFSTPQVKKLKLAKLKIGRNDYLFLLLSLIYLVFIFIIGHYIQL
ncbi:energy-coupling factor transporter transmembrane protein EcfT [Sporolactobacillus sp. CPB3-1]|uniref:Energy-coupling factor transporter transmembrane protein EcfT n=1 Tax=Sporolactobacillus mangiferae TaxID=2940498 RepID=A0ABT0MDE1_9BACL|nr:energy-coupling factor transporter transmembrane component T [Sporolactobacillus mangiferae]MCL1632335.1 energy-coupling factor transporter transmembrane protein EcfT [Sporolactobacillus mangiferae]